MSALRVLPWALHVACEYLAGIFLVVSPFVFGFTESTALPAFLFAGVIVLATAVLSRGALGVYGFLPVWAQALIDYLIAFALMIAPFAVGFREEADALLVSVMTGLGLLVMSLLSRYPQPAPAPAHPDAEEATGSEEGAAQPEADADHELPTWARGSYDEASDEADDVSGEDDEGDDADERWAAADEPSTRDETDADRRR